MSEPMELVKWLSRTFCGKPVRAPGSVDGDLVLVQLSITAPLWGIEVVDGEATRDVLHGFSLEAPSDAAGPSLLASLIGLRICLCMTVSFFLAFHQLCYLFFFFRLMLCCQSFQLFTLLYRDKIYSYMLVCRVVGFLR